MVRGTMKKFSLDIVEFQIIHLRPLFDWSHTIRYFCSDINNIISLKCNVQLRITHQCTSYHAAFFPICSDWQRNGWYVRTCMILLVSTTNAILESSTKGNHCAGFHTVKLRLGCRYVFDKYLILLKAERMSSFSCSGWRSRESKTN